MSKVHAVLYTKTNCMPCKMTSKLIEKLNLPFKANYHDNLEETNLIDVASDDEAKREWSERKIEKLKAKYNITSLPFVKILDDDTGEELDTWTGFVPDKLKFWTEYNKEEELNATSRN